VDDLVAKVLRMREIGSGITNSGRPAAGVRKLRAALSLAQSHGAPWLIGRVLISLGFAEAEQGNTEAGLRLLDEAEEVIAPEHRGVLVQNRGTILERAGRTDEALPLFDAALPLLTEVEDWYTLASALLNRATLHLGVGRVRQAREDLRRCQDIAEANNYDLILAKVDHDLAYCHRLAGDIPLALRAFDAAAQRYRELGPGYLAVIAMDKARTMLTAGLAGAAGLELDAAFQLFRGDRLSVDYAWAELTRAQVELALGDHRAARMWSHRAARRFRRHGDAAWAALAELTTIRADLSGARRPAALAAAARRLADRLWQLGLRYDADAALLLAARASVRAGRKDEAESLAASTARPSAGSPLELRLLRRLVCAELSATRGAALSHLRKGLGALNRHRVRLGSVELRVGASALGVELAGAGLDIALRSGNSRLVFDWSERCRAQAFRIRPVRPPADPELSELLAELRQLSRLNREAELNGSPDPCTVGRLVQLERQLRQREWQQDGAGESIGLVPLQDVRDELAAANAVMIGFIGRETRLFAIVITPGGTRLVDLCDLNQVHELTKRLVSDLDALSGWLLPAELASVLRGSAQWHLDQLWDRLLAPLFDMLGSGAVIVAPSAGLSAVPWGLLPGLRGRAVSVVPSASVWARARRLAGDPTRGGELLVAGPHLDHAESEVRELARIYPNGIRLTGETATVEATLRGLDGADVAHLAAHGHHEADNVLFSRLDLADGPLLAYDIQRLPTPPRHVVLSACDVGQAVVRAGDEILGLTAAMLYIGTITVVSSVARVPDDVAMAVMAEYHRAVAGGAEPAQALAGVLTDDSLVPLVCFGAG
jgi:tetratricopeptide (TPR) repeat protein